MNYNPEDKARPEVSNHRPLGQGASARPRCFYEQILDDSRRGMEMMCATLHEIAIAQFRTLSQRVGLPN